MEFIVVGRVISQRGVRGEVKVEVLTDFPDRFEPGKTVYTDGQPLTIRESRPQKNHLLIKFDTIDDVEEARQLRGKALEIPENEIHELPEGEYYRFQIVGLEVWSSQGEPVGRITDILPTGSNDVYIVQSPQGEVLIPSINEVIKSIDLNSGRMIIEIIDGLF